MRGETVLPCKIYDASIITRSWINVVQQHSRASHPEVYSGTGGTPGAPQESEIFRGDYGPGGLQKGGSRAEDEGQGRQGERVGQVEKIGQQGQDGGQEGLVEDATEAGEQTGGREGRHGDDEDDQQRERAAGSGEVLPEPGEAFPEGRKRKRPGSGARYQAKIAQAKEDPNRREAGAGQGEARARGKEARIVPVTAESLGPSRVVRTDGEAKRSASAGRERAAIRCQPWFYRPLCFASLDARSVLHLKSPRRPLWKKP